MSWLKISRAARRLAGAAKKEPSLPSALTSSSKFKYLRVFKLLGCTAPAAVMGHAAVTGMTQHQCDIDGDVAVSDQPRPLCGQDETELISPEPENTPSTPPPIPLGLPLEPTLSPSQEKLKDEENSFKSFIEAADLSLIESIDHPIKESSMKMMQTQANVLDLNFMNTLVPPPQGGQGHHTHHAEVTGEVTTGAWPVHQALEYTAGALMGLMEDVCYDTLHAAGGAVGLL